jgi:trehalose 6-phosphate synthase
MQTIPSGTQSRPLCVLAHRLPIEYVVDIGWQRSPGGLVSALRPALSDRASQWFGHVRASDPPVPLRRYRTNLVPIPVTDIAWQQSIDGCCNRTLWPALHGMIGNVEEHDAWWATLFEQNDRTACVVGDRAQTGAIVWVHDYHHFGVAQELKRRRRDLRVGLSCHTPIVADVLGSLSSSRQLLERLSHFDAIATQTEGDSEQLIGLFDRFDTAKRPTVRSIPVGIDVDNWVSMRTDDVVAALASRLRAAPGMLAVGVDRGDYTKGLLAKLLAFEFALGNGSIRADDIRLIQVATATRQGIPAYDHVQSEAWAITDRINASFPRFDGRRVVELRASTHSQRELAGLMRAADIMLVTPRCDGMNLVALESSVANADRPVEVVLSRRAGAADYIGDFCRLIEGADVLSIAAELVDVVGRRVAASGVGGARRPGSGDGGLEIVQLRATSANRAAAAERLTAQRWSDHFLAMMDEVSINPDREPFRR